MSKRYKNILMIILALCVILSWGYMCYLVRDTVLACHDSMMEFINARVNGWRQGFSYGMSYSLARGKVGIIFPLVIMFRFMVNGSGNYTAIWLLQYVPVFANVALIGVLFGKKVSRSAGLFFALFFFSFLQLDIWHCLITCYPLDFMYGLFLMITGLWLYSDWLDKAGQKRNIIRLIISLICFYESMQVYEAFIVASLVYAVLSLSYARKSNGSLPGFIKKLIPHFTVAVIYIGILFWLRSHPVIETEVPAIDSHIDPVRVAKTAYAFSTGMFPLKDIRILPSVKDLFLPVNISKKAALTAMASALGSLIAVWLTCDEYRNNNEDERKATQRALRILTAGGVLIALSYPLPHALIPSYQDWVINGASGGYLPTTISYFGWSVAIVSLILSVMCYISAIKPVKLIALAGIICYTGAGTYITININNSFRCIESFSGTVMSVKYRTFCEMITQDDIRQMGIDYFYMPAYGGVHGNIETDESLADMELGYDVELINGIEGNEMLLQENDSAYMIFDSDARAGLLIRVDDYTLPGEEWTTSSPVFVFSAFDEDLVLLVTDEEGKTHEIPVNIEGGRGTYADIPGTISAYAVDVYPAG